MTVTSSSPKLKSLEKAIPKKMIPATLGPKIPENGPEPEI
jgi:hypothetical protein